MPFFGFRSLRIEIANGSEELIFCSITADTARVIQRNSGVGLNVGMVGAEGNACVQYQHELVDRDGYISIVPGNTFKFNPSGKPIYLTILSQTNKKICVNLEVNKSSNYIVSKNCHLKQAAKGKSWIGEDGRDHQLVKVESFEYAREYSFKHVRETSTTTNNSERYAKCLDDPDPVQMFHNLRISCSRDHASAQNLPSSIEVSISNGSPNAILCRVSKDKSKKRDGSKASCLEDGHTTIGSLSSFPFSSSGNPVYMTIITDSGKELCVNHEISKSSNFVISRHLHLKTATTGQLWVDSTGKNHARPDSIDKVMEQNMSDHSKTAKKGQLWVDSTGTDHDIPDSIDKPIFSTRQDKITVESQQISTDKMDRTENLLRNPNGKDGLDYWDIVCDGGDRFKCEESADGCRFGFENVKGQICYWATSYQPCVKMQVVYLPERGISDTTLDYKKPPITVEDWYSSRFDCGCEYKITVRLLGDDKETELDKWEFSDTKEAGAEWSNVRHVFTDYPSGVRYVEFRHGGQDTKYWAGHYGVKMTYSSVCVG